VLTRTLLPHHGSRFGALDGYRALAALAVVVYHLASPLGWFRLGGDAGVTGALISNLGNFGVAIFFLLSGFLLYRPFARAALADEPGPATLRFLRHRVLRIYPAYWVALTAAIVLVGVANPSGEKYAILYLLVQNYRAGHALLGLGVAWTLVIEVSFYITLPFLAWGIRLLGRRAASIAGRMRAQLLGLGLLAAASLLYRFTLAVPSRPFQTTHLWLPNFLDWFALGMLLAVCVAWVDLGGRLPRWFQALADNWWAPVLLAAQSYVVLALLRLDARSGALGGGQESEFEMAIRFFFNGVGAFFLLLPVVLDRDHGDLLHRTLGGRSLALLGTMSYGVYLWHTIWIKFIANRIWDTTLPLDPPFGESALLVVSVFALTFAAALGSFLLIEHPVMRFKDSARRRSGARAGPIEPAVVAEPVAGVGR
jgi:peptidoglycan/LPS O-acetylase OafA/YrhL